MRKRLAAVLAFATLSLCGATRLAVAAPADSSAVSPAPADSSAAFAVPDSTSRAAAPPRPTARPERGDIDSDRLRYDGRTASVRLFESRWPVDGLELPFAGASFSNPRSLDAGVALNGWRSPATDRTPISNLENQLGTPNAATAAGAPGDAASDPFLVTRWEAAGVRPLMRGPAELLARPRAVLWWEDAIASHNEPTTSALFYEKGELGVVQAGARFVAPGLFKGLAGGYVLRETEGVDAWFRAEDRRYALVGSLPRVGLWSARLEGDIAERRLESSIPDTSNARASDGEARFERQALSLHAERAGRTWQHALRAGVSLDKHTQIDVVDHVRERWDEPGWIAEASTTWRPGVGWTWIATARGVGRGIHARSGPGTSQLGELVDEEFAISRNEGRAGLAVRREAVRGGASRGWSADVAVDGRARDRGFVDGRFGLFAASRRGIAQLDLETAHERPTWEDRLTVSRDIVFPEDGFNFLKSLRYTSSADPSLEARRLTGGAARGVWRPRGGTELEATASVRRVTDDFGWNLTRTETADTVFVEDRAVLRGSGWTGHVSLAAAASWRAFRMRVLGWTRTGDRTLTPLGGAVARVGLDATLEAGATLFQGDLPLRAGLDAHVTGDREGAFRAAGGATVDASLRADFVQAGVYFRIDDIFDRRLPSGAYDLVTDAGVPSAGRRFRFGVVWHLSD